MEKRSVNSKKDARLGYRSHTQANVIDFTNYVVVQISPFRIRTIRTHCGRELQALLPLHLTDLAMEHIQFRSCRLSTMRHL